MKRSIVAVITAAAALVAAPTAAAWQWNNTPGGLMVFQNNVENLSIDPNGADRNYCGPPRTERIMFAMAAQTHAPDIALIQQVNGKGSGRQLDILVNAMNSTFRTNVYAGIVSNANPVGGGDGRCSYKDNQTNAIIYRTDRLYLVGYEPFRSLGLPSGSTADCGQYNGSERTVNLFARFIDLYSNYRNVKAVSFHWPRDQRYDKCANVNAYRVADYGNSYPGDLTVVGGDSNVNRNVYSSGSASGYWYQTMVGPKRFVDATSDADDIDFLFTRRNQNSAGSWLYFGPVVPSRPDYGGGHPAVVGYALY